MKTNTPAWLTDEAIERTQAHGDELAKFLFLRHRRKQTDPNARVRIGPRLRKMFAELEKHKK